MKAFLSTGPQALFGREMRQPFEAEREARAILAVVESPEPYGLVNGSPTVHGTLRAPAWSNAEPALAEALAAFVGDAQ